MEIGSPSLQKHSTTTDHHVSIDITNEDNNNNNHLLTSSIKQKMSFTSLSHSVSRVPQHISKEHPQNYLPALVSIGPLHRHADALTPNEGRKWRYLNALLGRKPNPERVLESCVSALRDVENEVRNFYGERINTSSDELVEMLLLDGCFVIELFIEHAVKGLRRRDDPFFASNDTIRRLRCDLILFENQVPFFALERIFRLVPIPTQCRSTLSELALCFFRKLIPLDNASETCAPQTNHLLDLIRQHYLPTVPKPTVLSSGNGPTHIDQATRLVSSGISLERAVSKSPSDITFSNGRLKIPCFEIDSYTEILFTNLVAMETYDPRCSKHVTSYAFLMGRLVRSRRDVRLLREKGILIDGHGREREIVEFLQGISGVGELNEDEFYYKGICEEINEYQVRGKHLWREKIRDAYNKGTLGIGCLSFVVVLLVVVFAGGVDISNLFYFAPFSVGIFFLICCRKKINKYI